MKNKQTDQNTLSIKKENLLYQIMNQSQKRSQLLLQIFNLSHLEKKSKKIVFWRITWSGWCPQEDQILK